MSKNKPKRVEPGPKTEGLVKMNFDPLINNLSVRPNKDLIAKVRSLRNGNHLVSLILGDGIQLMPNMILPLFEVLQSIGKTDNLDVFLYTTGGATEVPWRIVSLIREFCKQYTAIIPFVALSAGTHIALGADQLLMSEISTLGPVDPSTRHSLLPKDEKGNPINVSVEDLKNCIKFIAQQLHDQGPDQKYSPTDMTNIVSKLFEHIEPLAIGAVERAYGLSRLITRKVLVTHLDPEKDKEVIEKIIDKIGGEYFSHSFPITRRDVEQELKLKVEKPGPDLFGSIWELYEYYRKALSAQQDVQITIENRDSNQNVIGKMTVPLIIRLLGFLDSENERRVLLQMRTVEKKEEGVSEEPRITMWVKPSPMALPADFKGYFLAKPPQSPVS